MELTLLPCRRLMTARSTKIRRSWYVPLWQYAPIIRSLTQGPAQLTDWLAHVPKEVIAKNFQTSVSAFDRVPNQQLYIFPGGRQLSIPLHFDSAN